MFQATTDTRPFELAARAWLDETWTEARPFLRQQARLVLEDVVHMTPPFSNQLAKGVTTQAYAAQRKVGQAAVRRDVGRVFMPVEALDVVKHPRDEKGQKLARLLKGYVALGETRAIEELLGQLGFRNVTVHAKPDGAAHYKARDKRGRVREHYSPKQLVLNQQAIDRYASTVAGRVGRAKAGWAVPARALGLTLPQWITKHATPGTYAERQDATRLTITLGNLVEWGPDFVDLAIIQKALGYRVEALTKGLARILERGVGRSQGYIPKVKA